MDEFKRGFQLRSNLVKDDNVDLLADSHNILNMWKIYISQLLNVHNVSDVRQIAVHTAEPLVPGPSRLEVETVIAKTESNKTTVRNAIFCVHSLLHQLTQHVSAPHRGHPQV
jgi:hypothetical protein